MVPSERALKTKSKTGVKSFTPFCLGSALRKTNSAKVMIRFVQSTVIALQNLTLKFLKPTRKLFLVSLERCGEFNLILFADEDEEKPEVKVTADTDSEDEEVEEAAETTTLPADKPSVPPLNSTKHTQQKSAATVSLITKHNNGTLNMWNVMFADKSRFGNLLNIRYNHLSLFVCRASKRMLVKKVPNASCCLEVPFKNDGAVHKARTSVFAL